MLLGPVGPVEGCPALVEAADCWALLGGDGLLRPLPLAVKTPPSAASVVLTTDGLRSWRCGDDVGDLAQLTLASPTTGGSLEGIPNPPEVELLLPLFAAATGHKKNDYNFRLKQNDKKKTIKSHCRALGNQPQHNP